jgi:hypothetical protein
MMRPFTFALVSVLMCGCSASLHDPGVKTPVTVTRLRSDPISFATYSQLRQAERLVIRDDASWHAAWQSIFPPLAPILAPPNVDFTKEMVVFVALGERPNSGYSILVDSAAKRGGVLEVWIGTVSPGAHCGTTLALTQTVDIARLPRIDAAVHFMDVPRVVECP